MKLSHLSWQVWPIRLLSGHASLTVEGPRTLVGHPLAAFGCQYVRQTQGCAPLEDLGRSGLFFRGTSYFVRLPHGWSGLLFVGGSQDVQRFHH